MSLLKILCIGDVIGRPGIRMLQKWISKIKNEHSIDAIIVNGENSAKNGMGLSSRAVNFFKHNGVSVITSGNHIFECKEIYNLLNESDYIVRPANYSYGCPGKGYTFFNINEITIAVLNLHGRIFIKELFDCPFKTAESILSFIKIKTNIIIVDFHAEATAEKKAMGLFLDGQVSCVFGTHTHVATSDEHILPKGTAYITDIGCVGALDSVIGMKFEGVLQKFLLSNYLGRFSVDERSAIELNGILVSIDSHTGMPSKIERLHIVDNEIPETDIENL